MKWTLPCYGIEVVRQGETYSVTSTLWERGDPPLMHAQWSTVEQLVLNAVRAGIDVQSPAFVEAIESTVAWIHETHGAD